MLLSCNYLGEHVKGLWSEGPKRRASPPAPKQVVTHRRLSAAVAREKRQLPAHGGLIPAKQPLQTLPLFPCPSQHARSLIHSPASNQSLQPPRITRHATHRR